MTNTIELLQAIAAKINPGYDDRKFDRLCPLIRSANPFIVMEASEKMPASCRGRYGKIAVVQTDGTIWPLMISDRAQGVVRIVEEWRKLNVGGARSAYALALVEARELCHRLNVEHAAQRLTPSD